VRIVGGRFRGRVLRAPEGLDTRPTGDRARQAIFNVLEHAAWSPLVEPPRWNGRRVLDLFAGSGALGLEAMSRGAAFCLFVETDERARGAIRDNVEAASATGSTRIHRRDATDLGPRPASAGAAFDFLFLDPPYGRGLGERALAGTAAGGWMQPGALAVWERGAGEAEVEAPGWSVLDARTYGAARVLFLRFTP
jgi:16S rRNA (guanine966-N2)-methyltransferase